MGKRLNNAQKEIDANKVYGIEEAVALAKKTATTKFVGNVEVHVRLGIDPKQTSQTVRATVTLPHGTGRSKKIAVFKGPEGEELIKKIKETEKVDFDMAIAEPAMMPKLAQIAKILGPKGLMPNPKSGTVTTDIEKTVQEFSSGKTEFKNDDSGNVHITIGKTNFDDNQLIENLKAFMVALRSAKPSEVKKEFIQSISLHATMCPAFKIKI
ncbi:MAG: 50S ribosomal protein L1 [Candidatus Doudnabacteria bacterium]|nr:50S ribosomal protein L1 [Candidatus Doudnabacteria bacterium]